MSLVKSARLIEKMNSAIALSAKEQQNFVGLLKSIGDDNKQLNKRAAKTLKEFEYTAKESRKRLNENSKMLDDLIKKEAVEEKKEEQEKTKKAKKAEKVNKRTGVPVSAPQKVSVKSFQTIAKNSHAQLAIMRNSVKMQAKHHKELISALGGPSQAERLKAAEALNDAKRQGKEKTKQVGQTFKAQKKVRDGKGFFGGMPGFFGFGGKDGKRTRSRGKLGKAGKLGLFGGLVAGAKKVAKAPVTGIKSLFGKGKAGSIDLAKKGFRGLKGVLGKAGPIALLFAAADVFSGFNNADTITGLKPEKLTLMQKVLAGVSQAISSLTFGALDSKKVFQDLFGEDGSFAGVTALFKDTIMPGVKGLFDNGVALWETVSPYVGKAGTALWDGFTGTLKFFFGKEGLFTNFTAVVDKVKGFGFDVFDDIVDGLAGIFGANGSIATFLKKMTDIPVLGRVAKGFLSDMGVKNTDTDGQKYGEMAGEGIAKGVEKALKVGGFLGDVFKSFAKKEVKAGSFIGKIASFAGVEAKDTDSEKDKSRIASMIDVNKDPKAKKELSSVKDLVSPTGGDKMRITSGFGRRKAPTGQGKTFSTIHRGVDIAAAEGEPIYAMQPGVIKKGKTGNPANDWVDVIGDNGYVQRNIHVSHLSNLKDGQRVEAGQAIGQVYAAGTGAHQHLEIKKGGKYIDPLAYMQEGSKREATSMQAKMNVDPEGKKVAPGAMTKQLASKIPEPKSNKTSADVIPLNPNLTGAQVSAEQAEKKKIEDNEKMVNEYKVFQAAIAQSHNNTNKVIQLVAQKNNQNQGNAVPKSTLQDTTQVLNRS